MTMKLVHKKVFAAPRSRSGPAAQTWSFSLYPQHAALIRAREAELNLGRSGLVQLLLEVEEKRGLLREELLQRLATPRQPEPAPCAE